MESNNYEDQENGDVFAQNQNEQKHYRECDDMLSRRIHGNLPGPLRKKRAEDYKKFITPTGGGHAPLLNRHMRSKSTNDLTDKDDQDQRNERYEQLQTLKELLKEEEDSWTSNLQSWKSRRRSVTSDIIKRKEDRETVESSTNMANRRKSKTYREIVEDKRRREFGMFTEDDKLSPRLESLPTQQPSPQVDRRFNNKAYRGAKSTPNVHQPTNSNNNNRSNHGDDLPPPPASFSDNNKYQTKYLSQVTTMINVDNQSPRDPPATHQSRVAAAEPAIAPTTDRGLNQSAPVVMRRPVIKSTSDDNTPRSYGNPISTSGVVMRKKNPGAATKERPKSEFNLRTVQSSRGATLPSNYHSYSTPKPFVAGQSNFQKYRRTAFASKRNMWESMSTLDGPDQGNPAAPKHLADLLQKDTNRLNGEETAPLTPTSPSSGAGSAQTTDSELSPKSADPLLKTWPKMESSSTLKTGSGFRPVAAPVNTNNRPSWSRSATLPNRSSIKVTSLDPPSSPRKEEPQIQAVAPVQAAPPKTNGLHTMPVPKTSYNEPMKLTPREEPLFDDMKICINQKPRSEKGFGFTVRGGDDGKPVIVNTVSPGGAADICQLCVGDEILAINDVRLDSSLTQDGIVQLIVDSVITGNLALDIRRYGKAKKNNPLRLSGTKVVMTSGGFVQVRSDRGRAPVVASTASLPNGRQSYYHSPSNSSSTSTTNDDLSSTDLPAPPANLLPPSPNLAPPTSSPIPPLTMPAHHEPTNKKQSALERLSPKSPFMKPPSPRPLVREDPLDNLIRAARAASIDDGVNNEPVVVQQPVEVVPPPPPSQVAPQHHHESVVPIIRKESFDDDEDEEDARYEEELRREVNHIRSASQASGLSGYQAEPSDSSFELPTSEPMTSSYDAPPPTSYGPPITYQAPAAVQKSYETPDYNQNYNNHYQQQPEEEDSYQKKLLEEQRILEENEMRRDEERRRRIEEAKMEEMKLEQELKKINAQELEAQKRREAEKRRLIESNDSNYGLRSKNSGFNQGTFSHWLIDEAERSRLAEEQGRVRANPIAEANSHNNMGGGGALPDHVIQRLTQRSQANPRLPNKLVDLWNDPKTQATLL